MSSDLLGVRRQSESGDGALDYRKLSGSKAGSRFACNRTPKKDHHRKPLPSKALTASIGFWLNA